jgi:hypothetical protein
MSLLKKNRCILVISDTHIPYHHKDLFFFLKALRAKYKPDRVIHIGDEIDLHSISYHENDPDLLSPAEEFRLAIEYLKALYVLFPKVDVIESNHGSLVYRKARTAGLPVRVLRSYNEVLEAPKGWKWHYDLTVRAANGQHIYFTHGKVARSGALSRSMGMCSVQGHYHEKFEITYWANPLELVWDMRVGCLIDDNSLAFAYNNTNLKRPIIGTGVIKDGQPILEPMLMDGRGRWTGKLK